MVHQDYARQRCPHDAVHTSDNSWHDFQTWELVTFGTIDDSGDLEESSFPLDLEIDLFDFRYLCISCASKKLMADYGLRASWKLDGMSWQEQKEWTMLGDSAFSWWSFFSEFNNRNMTKTYSKEMLREFHQEGLSAADVLEWEILVGDLTLWCSEVVKWNQWGVAKPSNFLTVYGADISDFNNLFDFEYPPPLELRTLHNLGLRDVDEWVSLVFDDQPETAFDYPLVFLNLGIDITRAKTIIDNIENDFWDEFVNPPDLQTTLQELQDAGLPLEQEFIAKWWMVSSEDILNLIDSGSDDEMHILQKRLGISGEHGVLFRYLFEETILDAEEIRGLINRGLTQDLYMWIESEGLWPALESCLLAIPTVNIEELHNFHTAGFDIENVAGIRGWRLLKMIPSELSEWKSCGFEPWEISSWRANNIDPETAARRRNAGITPRLPQFKNESKWDYDQEVRITPEQRFSRSLKLNAPYDFSYDDVMDLFGLLEPREAAVVHFRFGLDGFGEGRTLEESGNYFNLSRERIRQIEAIAYKKLRRHLLIE